MDDPRFKHVATDPRFKVSVHTVKYMCKLHVSSRFLIYNFNYLCTLVVKVAFPHKKIKFFKTSQNSCRTKIFLD